MSEPSKRKESVKADESGPEPSVTDLPRTPEPVSVSEGREEFLRRGGDRTPSVLLSPGIPVDDEHYVHVTTSKGIEVWIPKELQDPDPTLIHPNVKALASPERVAYTRVCAGSTLSHAQMMEMIKFLQRFNGVRVKLPRGSVPSPSQSSSKLRLEAVQEVCAAIMEETGIDPL